MSDSCKRKHVIVPQVLVTLYHDGNHSRTYDSIPLWINRTEEECPADKHVYFPFCTNIHNTKFVQRMGELLRG